MVLLTIMVMVDVLGLIAANVCKVRGTAGRNGERVGT